MPCQERGDLVRKVVAVVPEQVIVLGCEHLAQVRYVLIKHFLRDLGLPARDPSRFSKL